MYADVSIALVDGFRGTFKISINKEDILNELR